LIKLAREYEYKLEVVIPPGIYFRNIPILVKNNGTEPAYDVQWDVYIIAKLGWILQGASSNGIVNVSAGEVEAVRTNNIRGFAIAEVTATVGKATDTTIALIFGPFILCFG
jgi:hypothetical protein